MKSVNHCKRLMLTSSKMLLCRHCDVAEIEMGARAQRLPQTLPAMSWMPHAAVVSALLNAANYRYGRAGNVY